MKDTAIVQLIAEAINTNHEDNELDAPNLIPPDYRPNDESYDDDDGIGQSENLQIPVPFHSQAWKFCI